MTKSYSQVMKQIESLKQEAEGLRRKEIDGVIARIKEAISFYNLSASDLGLGSGRGRAGKARPAAKAGRKARRGAARKGAARSARFRDEQGNTWGGRGPRPKWLREALAAGKTLQDFEVRADKP